MPFFLMSGQLPLVLCDSVMEGEWYHVTIFLQRTARRTLRAGGDVSCCVESWTGVRLSRRDATKAIRRSRLWPCPGTLEDSVTLNRWSILMWIRFRTRVTMSIVPVCSCAGVMLLCWQGTPGAESSPGPVSETWKDVNVLLRLGTVLLLFYSSV